MARLIAILLTVFVIIFALCYASYQKAMRQTAIMEGKAILKREAKQLATRGFVKNSGTFTVTAATNTISVGATQHQYFITARLGKFSAEGLLTMTADGTFIWVNADGSPKIVDETYQPSLFPPRF